MGDGMRTPFALRLDTPFGEGGLLGLADCKEHAGPPRGGTGSPYWLVAPTGRIRMGPEGGPRSPEGDNLKSAGVLTGRKAELGLDHEDNVRQDLKQAVG